MNSWRMNLGWAVLLGLVLASCGEKPQAPVPKPFHVYLGHNFSGEYVTVLFDEQLMFVGRVTTEGSSQHAATIQLQPPAESFELKVRIERGYRLESAIKIEKIDLSKGRHLLVLWTGEENIDFFQTAREPEFY